MSFTRLAKVEVQLVMQCCDWRTLLALSRITHSARSAASDPFAWACVPPVALRSHSMEIWTRGKCQTVTFSQRLARSLLRLAPITLQWMESPSATWEEERAGLIDSLAGTPRLFGLDASAHHWLRSSELESLLLHPALCRLEFLSFAVHFNRRPTQCLTQWPRLRALHFTGKSLEAGCTAIIASLPALTELCISQSGGALSRECLRALLSCPAMESLILKGIGSDRSVLDLIALGPTSAFVRRLRALTLWDTPPLLDNPSLAEEWTAAFAALVGLQSLRLQECTCRTALVRAVLEDPPPSLTLLRIDESPLVTPMSLDHSAERSAARGPDAAAEVLAAKKLNLSMLLACIEREDPKRQAASLAAASPAPLPLSRSRPLLIDLHLPSLAQYQRLQGVSALVSQCWTRARDDAATLADRTKSSGSRIRVQSTVDPTPEPNLFHRAWVVPRAPEYAWDRTWF